MDKNSAKTKIQKLEVTIKTPDETLFSGEANSVSSINPYGPFDVLPRHASFISLVREKIVIYVDKRVRKEFPLQKGVLKNQNNKVKIFLGIENL